ncbi:thr operon leader peptide [Lonsdalea populi]|uniref:thr operon leader peptide n=1 Tax=Lonsdalea populi TaxID=1172565 RepID=A0A3N0UK81_9GAMM|nr:thr operon leader peptide [Lonsdalea populi]ROH80963.1 thr operon leader peptide [Lonsdalea populi]ROH82945.1 thr operon leader peptide [Lonsdalea populi]ROH83066.1 thr operon leader peptide [Lonsdalea populi]
MIALTNRARKSLSLTRYDYSMRPFSLITTIIITITDTMYCGAG